jgi:thiol-disulfide isomerase/thioredoxin
VTRLLTDFFQCAIQCAHRTTDILSPFVLLVSLPDEETFKGEPMRLTKLWIIATITAFTFSAPALAQEKATTEKTQADEKKDAKKAKKDGDAKKEDAKDDLFIIPEDADIDQLLAVIKKVKGHQPKSLEEFLKGLETMEKASGGILKEVKDKKSEQYDIAYTTSLLTRMIRMQVPGGEEVDVPAIYKDAKAYLTSKEKLSDEQAQIAATIPQKLEAIDKKLASEAYGVFGKLLKSQKEPRFAQFGEIMLGSGRRLNLVGSKMKVSGTTFAGEPFELDSLKGKVVLVDFWATWCGPCIAEIPNIKANYEKYHEKGFEVVGISIDEDRGRLDKFMADNEMPWTILHEKNEQNNPTATYYGVNAIPFMVLVGKDGKVVSTSARGPALDDLLEKLLGE